MVVAKIMQAESRDASLLASYAEVQLILCKDTTKNDEKQTRREILILRNCLPKQELIVL